METKALSELKTEFLCEISVDLEEPQPIGSTPHGIRQIFCVKGGSVDGPKIKGNCFLEAATGSSSVPMEQAN